MFIRFENARLNEKLDTLVSFDVNLDQVLDVDSILFPRSTRFKLDDTGVQFVTTALLELAVRLFSREVESAWLSTLTQADVLLLKRSGEMIEFLLRSGREVGRVSLQDLIGDLADAWKAMLSGTPGLQDLAIRICGPTVIVFRPQTSMGGRRVPHAPPRA